MGEAIYDKRGIPIERGDVVKVYHFTAALRRKRHYMYKQALGVRVLPKCDLPVMDFSSLNFGEHQYHEWVEDQVLGGYEIVQSIKCDHEDRPRKASP